LLGETEVSGKYVSQEVEIPSGEGKKKAIRAFCWNCASDRERLFFLVPERTDDGDLGPGKTIAVIDRTGNLEAAIAVPGRLTRIAVDGNTIFSIDVDSNLRIFRLEPK
jgi:hypothetical protein